MEILIQTLRHIEIGPETTYANLTMFPLLDGAKGEPDYQTLDEALASGSVRISEVSQGGTVPELKLINESDRRVLLLDGEELVGAKQNRVLNITILAPAKQTVLIPVSCVEAGRWSYRSAEFAVAPRAHYADGRARKMAQVTEAMLTVGVAQSNQGAIWEDISEKFRRMRMRSSTQAMSDMFEQQSTQIEDYVRAFTATNRQTGALFAIRDEVIGCDLFDYPQTLRKLLAKLVRSYALDALEAAPGKFQPPSCDGARDLLDRAAHARIEVFPAIGEGQDVRMTGSNLTGGALVADGRVIHLSAFNLRNGSAEGTHSFLGAIARSRVRRMQREG